MELFTVAVVALLRHCALAGESNACVAFALGSQLLLRVCAAFAFGA